MGAGETRFKVIGMLKDIEGAAAQLYETYAAKFPEHSAFWTDISDEEKNHVRVVHNLGSEIAQGNAIFVEDKFAISQIQEALDWIRGRVADAKAKDVSLKEALSTALEFENSLVEKEYYAIIKANNHDMHTFVRDLMDETRKHREKIEVFLKKEGGKDV